MSATDVRSQLMGVGMARRNLDKQAADIDRTLLAAVRRARGEVTVTEIARLVGVDRSTIYRMLDRN